MNVFVSTGAFRTKNIRKILGSAKENGIRSIEISPGLDYCGDIKDLLVRERGSFDFLIHNYFPTPRVPFALNLASTNEDVLERSMAMCREAVEFAADMGIPYYSVHCGYCFDTDGTALGNSSQVELPRIPYGQAKETFTECVRELCDFASKRGIGIAIENNVMAAFAAGNKELFLGVDADDMLELLGLIDRPNLGVLLDLAHAKVSAASLGFSLENMTECLTPCLMEVHISENDGKRDQNLPVGKDSGLLSCLKKIADIPVTLEVYDLSMEEIKQQVALLSSVQ